MAYSAESQQLARDRIAAIKQMLAERKQPKPPAPNPVELAADEDPF